MRTRLTYAIHGPERSVGTVGLARGVAPLAEVVRTLLRVSCPPSIRCIARNALSLTLLPFDGMQSS